VANSSNNNSLHDIFICYDDRDKDMAFFIEEEVKKEEPLPEIVTMDNYFINNKEIS
jgi:hypothetical protein